MTSAVYDASTNKLEVTGTGMTLGGAIDATKLTVTGQGGGTYTLAGSYSVTASSATQFTVALDGTDAAGVEALVNKSGVSSSGGTTYNLAAADDWYTSVTAGDTSDATNALISALHVTSTDTGGYGTDDPVVSVASFTRTVSGDVGSATFTVTSTDSYMLLQEVLGSPLTGSYVGLLGYSGANEEIIISTSGYTFDLNGFNYAVAQAADVSYDIQVAYKENPTSFSSVKTGSLLQGNTTAGQSLSGLTEVNDVAAVKITNTGGSANVYVLQNFLINDVKKIVAGPAATDGKISITSSPGGTNSTYKVGDTVTAEWDNTAGTGDNQSGVTGVTMDFSAFGGGAAVVATNNAGKWSASYQIQAGSIDGTNKNVSVTVTDGTTPSTTADTTNLTVDNQAPTVTDGNISISGGTGGVFKIGDTVTATWNNTGAGDNNTDTLASVTADFSQFGGGSAVAASNSSGTWTATYTILGGGAINGVTGRNVSFTVTDNAGNAATVADTTGATVDNLAPAQTITIDSLSDDTGTSATDFITKTASQTINAALSGALGGTDKLYGSVDGGTNWTDITAKVSGTTVTWDGATLSGTSSIKFKVTDAAGNDGTVATQAYTLDAAAPTAAVTTATIKNTANVSTAQSSEATGAVYLVLSSATVSDLASLEALVTATTAKKATVTAANTNTTISTAGLADGTYKVYAVDAAGNVSAASTNSITIDTTAPTLAATDAVNVAENSTAVKTVTATDNATVTYSIVAGNDGALFSIDASTGALTFSSAPNYENPTDVGDTAGNNTYVVTVRATDAAGNTTDQVVTATVTNVNEAPTLSTITTLSGATEDTAFAISYADLLAAANEADVDAGGTTGLVFRVEAVSTGALYTDAGLTTQVVAGTTTLGTGQTWYWKPAQDANGSGLNAFTVKAVDSGGLASSSAIQVKADVTAVNDAPTAVSPTTGTVSTFDSANATVATLAATDVDNTTWTFSIQSVTGPSGAVTNTNGAVFDLGTGGSESSGAGVATATLRAVLPSGLTAGTYTVTVRATDAGGLFFDQAVTVTVSDTLVVTTNLDSGADATTGGSYAAELADGGGLSLREALALASSGGKAIGFAAGLDGLTITLGSEANVATNTTFNVANSSFTIAGLAMNLTSGDIFNVGANRTLTINANVADQATAPNYVGFTKSGTGTLTLGSAANSETLNGTITVNGGTLSVGQDENLTAGTVAISNGGMLKVTGSNKTIDNAITLGANGGVIDNANAVILSGDITGSNALTKSGAGVLTLSGTDGQSTTTVTGGTLKVAGGAQLGSGAVTLNGGGLEITGASPVANALTLAAAGTLTNANATEWLGLVSGNYTLTKAGAGTLTLSNALNGASATTLELTGGAVSVASDSRLVGGAVTLNGGGLVISGADTIDNAIALGAGHGTVTADAAATLSGIISGSGNLTKDGTAALTVSGNNTFSGSLAVTAGTLIAAHNNALGATAGGTTVSSGAALGLSGGVTVAEAVSAAGTGVSASGAIYNVSGTNTLSGNVTLTAAATFGVNAGGLTVSGAISGAIGGPFALTKSGSETLTLSGANSAGFTTLTVSGGTVSVAADSALGSGAVSLAAGTTLQVTGATTIDNALTLTGSATVQTDAAVEVSGNISGDTYTLTKSGTGALTLSGTNNTGGTGVTGITVTAGSLSVGAAANLGQGTLTLNGGDLTLTGNGATIGNAVALSSAATITNAQAMTLSGNISGSGLLTKTGAGNLTLSGSSNSYSGGLQVNNGTLTGTTATLLGNIANSGTVVFDQATDGSYTGVISGSGAMTKSGAGNVTFTGANTYTGATTVSAGTLTLNNTNSSALDDTSAVTVTGTLALSTNETVGALSGAGTVTLGSNTLTVSQTTNTTFSGAIGGAGGLTKTGTGTLTLSGNNAYTGATNVSAGGLTLDRSGGALADTSAVTVAANATLTLNQSDTVGSISGAGAIALGANTLTAGGDNSNTTFSGVISGAGGNLVKAGTGTLTLSGANTYTGTTTVQGGGALSIAGDGNLGTGALTLNAATLSVTGATTIDNAITLTGAAVISNSAAVTLSGILSGGGSLTMSGSGALTLSNTNSYSGATTVSSGRLHVTGSLNATSGVTVSSGATLSGTGSIFATSSTNTLTVASGGYLAPGTVGTAGQLTVNGNLILNGTLKLDLTGTTAGSGYDQVVVNGTVTLGAASAFDVTYTVIGGTNNTFIVIDNNLADAVTGTLNGVAEDGTLTSNARNYKVSYIGGSGNDVTLKDNSPPVFTSTAVTAVNEDSAYSYTVTTSDPDGNTVTVTATTLPSWLTFVNGVLSGTPGQAQIGNHTVVLTASDGNGGTTTQTFTSRWRSSTMRR